MQINSEIVYSKAFKELYTVIQILSQEEKNKIPDSLIENIKNNMDIDYDFIIDQSKSILEQNLMPQTQALIIRIYQKYLSPEEEKEKWEKYNQICYKKDEEEKRNLYSPDDIFKPKQQNINIPIQTQLIPVKKETFIQKIFNKLKQIFKFR